MNYDVQILLILRILFEIAHQETISRLSSTPRLLVSTVLAAPNATNKQFYSPPSLNPP